MGLRVSQLANTKKEAFDTQKWFFGNNTGTSSNKRKFEHRDEEWEVWPEEEFEQAQAAEHAEQLEMMQELDEEVGKQLRSGGHPKSDIVEQSVTSEVWNCPICNRPQPTDDAIFNQHVDFCLSKQAIREAVQESASPPPPSVLPRLNNKKPKVVQRKQPSRGKK
jgi:DNA polymerase kappa